MARVDLEHVEKVYPNGTRAVVDCTLHVEDGELLVLVGPSGCGKSTVLRMVAGLEDVSAGTLRIAGAVVNDVSPQARNVAMVFQDYALYPQMTVRRNLEFPLRMRGMRGGDLRAQVERVAGLLDLAALLDRYPRQLSGGQRQRVAMGRALVREPAVSLLDEPLSNLDAKLRVQVRAEIAELQERIKTTMLYVTHDQTEAMTLGHRVAVMDRGRLQQVAPPRELYEAPVNTFVAGFMGTPPMNLLPARVTSMDGSSILEIGSQRLVVATTDVLRAATGASVTLGIRPEHLRLVEDGAPERPPDASPAPALAAVVEHGEWLGHETLAYLRLVAAGGEPLRLIARLPGMLTLEVDRPLRLTVDSARLHFFAADGRAIG
jgi:ABC-type sugar transport system ATPase subunit